MSVKAKENQPFFSEDRIKLLIKKNEILLDRFTYERGKI